MDSFSDADIPLHGKSHTKLIHTATIFFFLLQGIQNCYQLTVTYHSTSNHYFQHRNILYKKLNDTENRRT